MNSKKWYEISGGLIKIITWHWKQKGAMEFIKLVLQNISIGHSHATRKILLVC